MVKTSLIKSVWTMPPGVTLLHAFWAIGAADYNSGTGYKRSCFSFVDTSCLSMHYECPCDHLVVW